MAGYSVTKCSTQKIGLDGWCDLSFYPAETKGCTKSMSSISNYKKEKKKSASLSFVCRGFDSLFLKKNGPMDTHSIHHTKLLLVKDAVTSSWICMVFPNSKFGNFACLRSHQDENTSISKTWFFKQSLRQLGSIVRLK